MLFNYYCHHINYLLGVSCIFKADKAKSLALAVTSHHLGTENTAITLEQLFQLFIVQAVSEVLDVDVGEVISTPLHALHAVDEWSNEPTAQGTGFSH